jgi:aconitate hydratase
MNSSTCSSFDCMAKSSMSHDHLSAVGEFDPGGGKVSNIISARTLAIFGDSVTTDHISPAGTIKETSPAGRYLLEKGVATDDFQSYGTRRGNHEVMVRGTFANVRIKNLMVPPKHDGTRVEGGITLLQPSGQLMSVYDAATKYRAQGIPTVVLAGEEYGTGSSRDWAKEVKLLLRIDTSIEVDYFKHGGILPYVLRELIAGI